MSKSHLALTAALAIFTPLAGCSSTETNCSTEARASLSITVVDASGAKVRDAVVTFSVDDRPSETAECITGGSAGCDSWVAGWERTGVFAVTAKSADGSKTARRDVTVTRGECHVNGSAIVLTLS